MGKLVNFCHCLPETNTPTQRAFSLKSYILVGQKKTHFYSFIFRKSELEILTVIPCIKK